MVLPRPRISQTFRQPSVSFERPEGRALYGGDPHVDAMYELVTLYDSTARVHSHFRVYLVCRLVSICRGYEGANFNNPGMTTETSNNRGAPVTLLSQTLTTRIRSCGVMPTAWPSRPPKVMHQPETNKTTTMNDVYNAIKLSPSASMISFRRSCTMN